MVCLNIILPALCQLAKKRFADHLPSGVMETDTGEMRRRSRGTEKHNKFSEPVFGYLDRLLRTKPNVSALASEAFVMFSNNKTDQWLEGKNEDEKIRIIYEAVHDVSRVRDNYKKRTEEIEANQKRKVEESIRVWKGKAAKIIVIKKVCKC